MECQVLKDKKSLEELIQNNFNLIESKSSIEDFCAFFSMTYGFLINFHDYYASEHGSDVFNKDDLLYQAQNEYIEEYYQAQNEYIEEYYQAQNEYIEEYFV